MDSEFVTKYLEVANMYWKCDNISEFAVSLGFRK